MKRSRALALMVVAACGDVTSNGNSNPPPLITEVSPGRGGVPGGHTITLNGAGFPDNNAGEGPFVGGIPEATDVVAEDDSTLTFKLPPGPAPDAVVDLVVFNNNGFAVMPDAVQYNPLPTLTAVTPNRD